MKTFVLNQPAGRATNADRRYREAREMTINAMIRRGCFKEHDRPALNSVSDQTLAKLFVKDCGGMTANTEAPTLPAPRTVETLVRERKATQNASRANESQPFADGAVPSIMSSDDFVNQFINSILIPPNELQPIDPGDILRPSTVMDDAIANRRAQLRAQGIGD